MDGFAGVTFISDLELGNVQSVTPVGYLQVCDN